MTQETLFRKTFGNTPTIRILDYLLEGRELDYSLSDIARNANVGWTTLHKLWDNLIKSGMVNQTRMIGKAKLFKINLENQTVKHLVKVYDTLLIQNTENNLKTKVKALA